MSRRAPVVLVVDDDDVDVAAVRRAFAALDIDTKLVVAADGARALKYLRGAADGATPPEPTVVLLDLNMPLVDGIEFLDAIRADAVLNKTVVFVLTTSNAPADRRACYERNVAGYLLKQQAGKSFIDNIAMLRSYWTVNEFPN